MLMAPSSIFTIKNLLLRHKVIDSKDTVKFCPVPLTALLSPDPPLSCSWVAVWRGYIYIILRGCEESILCIPAVALVDQEDGDGEETGGGGGLPAGAGSLPQRSARHQRE